MSPFLTSPRVARAAACTPISGPGIAPPSTVPSGIPGFHAAWYGQSGYQSLCPGQTASAVVAYYNSGSFGWVSGRLGEMAYLGTWDPVPGQDRPSTLGGDGQFGSPSTGWPRYNRVAAQPASYVGPGQVAWFQFTLRAPSTPGTYRLALRPLIEGATWMEDYGVFWVFTVLPAEGGGATPTPIPTPSAVFTCTQVVGYSQTTSWYSDPNGFRGSAVDASRYELRWIAGGAVHVWADGSSGAWSTGVSFGCSQNANAPDRVVMDITEDFYIDDPANGGIARVASDIGNAIATIRSKYPSVRQIYLQPVVGGPGGGTCTVAGVPVRASVNHPYINQAIDQVIAGGSGGFDVRRGPSPTVPSCADYQDSTGHISPTGVVGQFIGNWYASNAPR
jgi:hypothetical protein